MRQFIITILTLIAMLLCSVVLDAKISDRMHDDYAVVDREKLKCSGDGTLEEPLPEKLIIDAPLGDVMLEGSSDDNCELRITWFEYEPGDATFYIEKGELKYRTRSGKPAAIRSLTGTIPKEIDLSIVLGAGDLYLKGMRGCGSMYLSSGAGELELVDLESIGQLTLRNGCGNISMGSVGGVREAVAELGMGDVIFANCGGLECIAIATGMGDVRLSDCNGTEFSISTGMGEINMQGCEIAMMDASTGMGNIVLHKSNFETSDFSTGMGRLINKDNIR